jgi:ABC-type uncharacterized transport system substrate-binding protein
LQHSSSAITTPVIVTARLKSDIAADLVERKVSVIMAVPYLLALVAKAAITAIPIVFEAGADKEAADYRQADRHDRFMLIHT